MKPDKTVVVWLIGLCAMIMGTLIVGGLTRLTQSGLSMVDWRPLMGTLPPLDHTEWLRVFEQYKGSPEFIKINSHMSLADFKLIFAWEYAHRLLARSLSLVFLVPWLMFIIQKRITTGFALKSFVGFLLGACQGLLGWYMVKSGLVDNPHVSHYRLAAHLSLALLIYCYFLWLILDLTQAPLKENFKKLKVVLISLSAVTALQIVYGAFSAGLKAGYIYNSFPKMNNNWLPANVLSLEPLMLNFFENPGTVQFIHRILAWFLLFAISALAFELKKSRYPASLKNRGSIVLFCIAIQFLLGVTNLLLRAPAHIAIIHQLGAVFLLTSLLVFTHKLLRN